MRAMIWWLNQITDYKLSIQTSVIWNGIKSIQRILIYWNVAFLHVQVFRKVSTLLRQQNYSYLRTRRKNKVIWMKDSTRAIALYLPQFFILFIDLFFYWNKASLRAIGDLSIRPHSITERPWHSPLTTCSSPPHDAYVSIYPDYNL